MNYNDAYNYYRSVDYITIRNELLNYKIVNEKKKKKMNQIQIKCKKQ